MATTKKSVAKKTGAAKRRARPSATTGTAAKPTATVDAVRESIASATRETDDTVKQYAAVASEQLNDALEFVRGVVDISVGIPFVVQARVADNAALPKLDSEAAKALLDDIKARLSATPSIDFDAVKAFLDEAKGEGHARIAGVQRRVDPVIESLRARYAA